MLTFTYDKKYLDKLNKEEHIFWTEDFLKVFFYGIIHSEGKTNIEVISSYFPAEVNNLHIIEIKPSKGNDYVFIVEGWRLDNDGLGSALTDPSELTIAMLSKVKDLAEYMHQNSDKKQTKNFYGIDITLHPMQYVVLDNGIISLPIPFNKKSKVPNYQTLLDPSERTFWEKDFVEKTLALSLEKLQESGEHNFPSGTCKLQIHKIFKDPRRNTHCSMDYILEVLPWIKEVSEDGEETLSLSDKCYSIKVNLADQGIIYSEKRRIVTDKGKVYNEKREVVTDLDPSVRLIGMSSLSSQNLKKYTKLVQDKIDIRKGLEMKLLASSIASLFVSKPSKMPEMDTHEHGSLVSHQNIKCEEINKDQTTTVTLNQ